MTCPYKYPKFECLTCNLQCEKAEGSYNRDNYNRYMSENLEKERERDRKRYDKEKDRRNSYNREWYKKHKAERQAYFKEYNKKKREKVG